MKSIIFAIPIALGLAGCGATGGLPPPPDPNVTGNIYAWLRFLCSWKPPLDIVVDALDDAGRLDDTQDIATVVCALKPPGAV